MYYFFLTKLSYKINFAYNLLKMSKPKREPKFEEFFKSLNTKHHVSHVE